MKVIDLKKHISFWFSIDSFKNRIWIQTVIEHLLRKWKEDNHYLHFISYFSNFLNWENILRYSLKIFETFVQHFTLKIKVKLKFSLLFLKQIVIFLFHWNDFFYYSHKVTMHYQYSLYNLKLLFVSL